MKLTLVRHTTLDIAPHICYGQSDVDVSANFDNERLALQRKLGDTQFDAIYTSPLRRCQQLARALCHHNDFGFTADDIQHDHRLKELNFGDWEMQAWDAIPRDMFDVWANDYANLAPPNGETFSQLHARAKDFVDEVAKDAQNQHLLVITHGGFIRALIAEVLQMPLKRLFRLSISHASVTLLEFKDDVPKVHFMNL